MVMTKWENHRTQSEFEDSFILKSFLFQCVNSYTSFFYIAFVRKMRFNLFFLSYTDETGQELPLRDSCSDTRWHGVYRERDCMGDLFVQMMIIVLFKQVAAVPACSR